VILNDYNKHKASQDKTAYLQTQPINLVSHCQGRTLFINVLEQIPEKNTGTAQGGQMKMTREGLENFCTSINIITREESIVYLLGYNIE
jgi:hypothetical protein